MGPYEIGTLVVPVVVCALVAWLVVRSVVRIVRFNLIKKKEGAEAAQQFWDAKKNARNASR